ncbi:MAG: MBL fold metallo-hydrolase, partial [Chitinophagales bacterium]
MQVQVLASGSKGNSILVEMGNTRILVDAGISARRIERGLEQIGIKASELDALLITHEHSDHIKGVEVLARRHSLPVYTRPLTWEGLGCRNRLPLHLQKEISQEISIGDIKVIPFNTSHDAADPVGYCFHFHEFKWVIATD